MNIRINGLPRELPALKTVAALVDHLGTPAETLLIEHNGNALRRADWSTTQLAEGDGIECLQIAAGG